MLWTRFYLQWWGYVWIYRSKFIGSRFWKNIYNHVIYDSEIERDFALEAENDDDVILYAKLPDQFKIDTPIGSYNPDWAVVLDSGEGEKVYFVAETKGTENINDLKGIEKKKILCGRKHFEVIDTGINYEVVKQLKTLKERLWKDSL